MNEHRIPRPLIILEMANNHMGSLDHGLRIVEAFAEICRPFPYQFAFKLQYRQLDTFIHPDYQSRTDLKYVKRFMETRLSREAFQTLVKKIKESNFLAVCTPFDQGSVGVVEEDDFDIIKVASCSFTDWPLLERIVKTDKPMIASTAAATVEDMDAVVSFLSHRNKEFALLHCVAEYPTAPEKIQLNQIDFLSNRYPHVPIGYSTHEPPNFLGSIPMVIAKGAEILERHVGLPTSEYPLNAYSASPGQLQKWLEAIQEAFTLCGGSKDVRVEAPAEEVASLKALRRGVFVCKDIATGKQVTDEDLFFAIPCQDNQVTANEWSKYRRFSTVEPIASGQPLLFSKATEINTRQQTHGIVDDVNRILKEGNIVVPGAAELEISHHYGIEMFRQTGATMITVINRQYCKKLIVLLPGQSHPEHYHKKKDESFYVLYGTLLLNLDGQEKVVGVGELVPLASGVKHSFRSDTGVVFEEVSTTHYPDDSFYTDSTILANPDRKTYLTYWMK